MATTVAQNVVEMTALGDQFLVPSIVNWVRFEADPASVATDVITLIDPVTSRVLWRTYAGSTTGVEAQLAASGDTGRRTWTNGFEVGSLPGNNGTLRVGLA